MRRFRYLAAAMAITGLLAGSATTATAASAATSQTTRAQAAAAVDDGVRQVGHAVAARRRVALEPGKDLELDEGEIALVFVAAEGKTAQAVGVEHPAFDHTEGAGSRPCHTLQKPTAVDTVMVEIV